MKVISERSAFLFSRCTMKKAAVTIFISYALLLPVLSMATDVGGIIDSDTVWNLAGSPYTVTNNVQVDEDVTFPHPETPISDSNLSPIAIAGNDQIVFDEVILNGSKSIDIDGSIASYEWRLQHRENSAYSRVATGLSPTISDLKPGFYDLTLIVTDNDGAKGIETILLAVSGRPIPNANLDVQNCSMINQKRTGKTTTVISANVYLPALNLINGDTVKSRITIELFQALAGGRDLIMSEEATLKVNESRKLLVIRK